MYQKAITTFTLCFYYVFFLAACESMIWLDKSSIIILTFISIHMFLKLYQWIDFGASSSDKNYYPYRNFSFGFKVSLIIVDTLVTFMVFFAFLYILNRHEETPKMYKYFLCFLCTIICIPNIVKHHKRQVEASSIKNKFTNNFDRV